MTLREVIPLTLGLFKHMAYDFGLDKEQLDLMLISYYGERRINNLVENLMVYGELTTDGATKLAKYIEDYHKQRWDRIKKVLSTEYDALLPNESIETTSNESSSDFQSKTFGYDSEVGVDDESNGTTASSTSTRTLKGRGNTFPSSLINAELNVRRNNFYNIVLVDTVKYITLLIY